MLYGPWSSLELLMLWSVLSLIIFTQIVTIFTLLMTLIIYAKVWPIKNMKIIKKTENVYRRSSIMSAGFRQIVMDLYFRAESMKL